MIVKEKVFIYNENIEVVAEFDMDTKRYQINGTTDNWLAAVILSQGVYSQPILYEKTMDRFAGAIYKRSSFLPQMVGKVNFLQNVQKRISGDA